MNFDFIGFEISEKIGIIRLNRPDVLNSFNKQMGREMQKALDICSKDENIRAVVITGEGRAFCAGQDLAEVVTPGVEIKSIVAETYNPTIRMIREIEKPVICVVNGVAAGAGANIALACDITVASESANFIQSFSKIGLIPDSAGTFFLPRLVGTQRAMGLMMLGDKLSAEKARDWGMIWEVFPDDKSYEEGFNIARKLAEMPTRGLGLTKKGVNKGFNSDLNTQLDLEEELQAEAGSTYDYNEGVQAFLEKRKPVFKGK